MLILKFNLTILTNLQIFYFFNIVIYAKDYLFFAYFKSIFFTSYNITRLRYFKYIRNNWFIIKEKSNNFNWLIYAEKTISVIYKLSRRYSILGTWKSFKALKKNKKLRKLNKVLRSITAPYIRVNYLKYIEFLAKHTLNSKKKNVFYLKNRVFINKKFIRKSIISLFYKKLKYKLTSRVVRQSRLDSFINNHIKKKWRKNFFLKKKIIMLNCHKKFYWKIRKSRIAHWDMLVGNRLNKYRYQKFIKKTIKIKVESPNNIFLSIFLAHTAGFYCSWRQVYLLLKYHLILINGKANNTSKILEYGDIIEICYGRGLEINKAIHKFLIPRIYYRLKRWSYLNRLNYQKPKRKRIYRKVPKSLKSLPLAFKKYSKLFMVLNSMGIIGLVSHIPQTIVDPYNIFYRTTVLKLNNWRYKF